MKRVKRVLALLIVAVLFCGMVSPTAFAEENFSNAAAAETLMGAFPVHPNSTEDYKGWRQNDPRWGSLRLGSSSCTVASDGCLVTSVTKLIIQAGFKNPDSFNVATTVNWLNANGGFTSEGTMVWGKISQMIPDFNLGTSADGIWGRSAHNSAEYNAQLLDYVRRGYHIVLEVNSGAHWVAVDEAKSLSTGQIYIMDSLKSGANTDVKLTSQYSTFKRAMAYTGGTTVPADSPPTGVVDEIIGGAGTVSVRGWAFDYDDVSQPVGIHVYIGTTCIGTCMADLERPDVNNAYPGVGNYHGYNATFNVNFTGTQTVSVYAIDLTRNSNNVLLGSRTVTIQGDNTGPVISNIYVTDIDATGYTVHCTVTDSSGVDRVQFPTWTTADGQDDLRGGWETDPACSGTRNGTVWSYRVKASDHNNEAGMYLTHIYAYDIYGNSSCDSAGGVEVPKLNGKIHGDINGDGKLNVSDMALLARYIAGDPNARKSVDKATADVNGDGKVNVMDLAYLSKLVAGWKP